MRRLEQTRYQQARCRPPRCERHGTAELRSDTSGAHVSFARCSLRRVYPVVPLTSSRRVLASATMAAVLPYQVHLAHHAGERHTCRARASLGGDGSATYATQRPASRLLQPASDHLDRITPEGTA